MKIKNSVPKKWELLYSGKVFDENEIIEILLKNRGCQTEKQKNEFLKPKHPLDVSLLDVGMDKDAVRKSITRIVKAIKNKEHILIYGDYDADGVCATAIMWESLYKYTKNVMPYIPNRFSEGYGINADSIVSIKSQNPKVSLIITVDNGIVACDAVKRAKDLGIDVIVTDHHQKGENLPDAYSIVHTDKISGAGISWIFCRELLKKLSKEDVQNLAIPTLDLCAIGTISDQMPLLSANRSFAKYGIKQINLTKRIGLKALVETAGLQMGKIGVYEINFQIAPRINATGRLDSAIDSLRLLCVKNQKRACELAESLNKTNIERQKILDEVLSLARKEVEKQVWQGVIVVAHETFHEGVIGLAASKIVEQYYLPAIVISKGESVSKASARSISGFNIIESIRQHSKLILNGGGHPMAAGFSIETAKIEQFTQQILKSSSTTITDEVKTRKLKIDLSLGLDQITTSLYEKLQLFEPVGVANPNPVFMTGSLTVKDLKVVGNDGKHIKLVLSDANNLLISAIGFNMVDFNIKIGDVVDVAYTIELNAWNGQETLELKLKDLKKHG
ncbi:MAG: single-stranded-DNA-specific exonuclease RecJ [Patescibacteria group bacterium]|nr:single-stranded-DNA-specific exonuclease RecJ [Patescibacteria group bacterium]